MDAPEAGDALRQTGRGGGHRLSGGARARPSSKAQAEERTLVYIDESGFYLLPALVRTYAPFGATPILQVPLSYDHASVISAITPEGRLLMQVQERTYKGPMWGAFSNMSCVTFRASC